MLHPFGAGRAGGSERAENRANDLRPGACTSGTDKRFWPQQPTMQKINALTERIIGLAIEVHRHLGPGLSEGAYERAVCIELAAAGLPYTRQIGLPVIYKGEVVAEYRPDVIVAELVVLEIKSVEAVTRVHRAQMLTYLRVTGRELGLILNFNQEVLRQGIARVVLQHGKKTL
jgi:GxxExxY protein